eukprot:9959-Heterococcus_DN1.PRE.1
MYNCALQDVYELSWQVDALSQTITFNATFTGMQPSSYFAVGISARPEGRMRGADIAFVAFQASLGGDGVTPSVTDRHGIANVLPRPDEELSPKQGHNDITGVVATIEGDVRRVQWKRPLAARDPELDVAINTDGTPQAVIWSFNKHSNQTQHQFSDRGKSLR